jgi:hypothetical protein
MYAKTNNSGSSATFCLIITRILCTGHKMGVQFISAILLGTFIAVVNTSACYARFCFNMRTDISVCLHVKCPLLENKLEWI